MLAEATGLARFPLDPAAPLRGLARAPVCGSTIDVSVALAGGRVQRVGARVAACAVGQAAAALFLDHTHDRDPDDIVAERAVVLGWLGGTVDLPPWERLRLLAAARDFPARHGAVLLPWDGFAAALSNRPARG
jgi:NifU-like protein involved in Fe-S cluster formation